MVAEEHDPMASEEEEETQGNQPAQKRSLKDLVTKVPQSNQDRAQTNSINEKDEKARGNQE